MVGASSPEAALKAADEKAKKKAQDQGQQQAKKRRLGRRNTDQFVDRSIAEHFSSYPLVALEHHKVDGLTLRATIARDHRKQREQGGRLGSGYWGELSAKFALDSGDLHVPDPSLPLDGSLISALKAATSSNTTTRSCKPLQGWLQQAKTTNSRELVGLARHIRTLRPSTSSAAVALAIDWMRFCVKVEAATIHSDAMAATSEVMDQALVQTWSALRSEGLGLSEWWGLYDSVAGLVLDKAPVQAIMSCKGSWLDVAAQLSAVTNSSAIGKKLFGHTASLVVGEQLVKSIAEEVGALTSTITMAQYTGLIDKITEVAKNLHADSILVARRVIELTYRGLPITIQVQSWTEELQCRLNCHLKGCSAGGSLDKLAFEDEVFGKQGDGGARTVQLDAAICRDWSKARETFNQLMASQDIVDGERLLRLAASKAHIFESIDRSWMVEAAVLEGLYGAGGEELIKQKVLSSLATKERLITLEHSGQLLQAVQESKLYKLANATARGIVDAIRELVANMISGIAPTKAHMMTSPFMQKVMELLPFFLEFKFKQGPAEKTVLGTDAVPHMLKSVEAKDAADKLEFADLTLFHTFSFLMTAEQLGKVRALSDKMLAKVQAGSKKKAPRAKQSAKQSAASSSSAGLQAEAKTQKVEDEVMSLFK